MLELQPEKPVAASLSCGWQAQVQTETNGNNLAFPKESTSSFCLLNNHSALSAGTVENKDGKEHFMLWASRPHLLPCSLCNVDLVQGIAAIHESTQASFPALLQSNLIALFLDYKKCINR